MGPVTYVIAILGCADGSAQCMPAATIPTSYTSEAACAAATPEALLANSDLDFPTLRAECRKSVAPASADRASQPPAPPALRRG